MESFAYDIAFVGAGLANGLAAYHLSQRRPSLKILIVDQRTILSRSQTWSFHDSDLTWNRLDHCRNWLADFNPYTWDNYEVSFPNIQRTLKGRYLTIRGTEFASVLGNRLKDRILLGRKITKIENQSIVLDDQSRIRAGLIIDGRGWQNEQDQASGFQKFVGLVLRLKAPHGLDRPIIMDARIAQIDGFRFMYVLPFTKDTLLVEDTRYSNQPDIDHERYKEEILAYCKSRQWDVSEIIDQELGCLPIPYWETESPAAQVPWPTAGMAGGFFHPTTGYSIVASLRFADFLDEIFAQSAKDPASMLRNFSQRFWQSGVFYRRLNNMLFFAAEPHVRYQVLEKFYHHKEDLIARFYAQKLNTLDRIRILSGRAPVPILKGISAYFRNIGVRHDFDKGRVVGLLP